MSVNCIKCVKNRRDGVDLLCSDCRTSNLIAERDKLSLFKKNTHILLDEAGVPPFQDQDCRVSHRIRWLAQQIAEQKDILQKQQSAGLYMTRIVIGQDMEIASLRADIGRMRNWIEKAHHLDGCHVRDHNNAKDCTCGRTNFLEFPVPQSPPQGPLCCGKPMMRWDPALVFPDREQSELCWKCPKCNREVPL